MPFGPGRNYDHRSIGGDRSPARLGCIYSTGLLVDKMADDVTQSDLVKAALDMAAEMADLVPRIPNPGNPPYVLPPRLTWYMYPLFQQAWFEADLRSGVGVLPKETEEE